MKITLKFFVKIFKKGFKTYNILLIVKREKIGKESLIRFSFDVQEKLKEIKNNSKASCGVSNHSPVHSRPPLYVQLLLPCVGGKVSRMSLESLNRGLG